MLVSGHTGTLFYKWLAHKTHRPRPYQVPSSSVYNSLTLDRFSLPTGHTLHAVAFGLVVLFIFHCLLVIMSFTVMVAMWRIILRFALSKGLH